MVKETFTNLDEHKKQRVTQALLHEFSQHSLADAQVARIVKEANIARGAFYKYFTDLTDAYLYLYQIALAHIHQRLALQTSTHPKSAIVYLKETHLFLEQTSKSPYFALIKMHLTYNESLLAQDSSTKDIKEPLTWAVSVLTHQAIKEVITHPSKQEELLAKLKVSLEALLAPKEII